MSKSILLEIPREILLEILSSLDLVNLNTTSSVCRALRGIIEDSKSNLRTGVLAEALFIDKVKPQTKLPVPDIQLHPCLSTLRTRILSHDRAQYSNETVYWITDLENIGFCNTSMNQFMPISKLPLMNDNATSPASNRIKFHLVSPSRHPKLLPCSLTPLCPIEEVSGDDGKPVKVEDLVGALAKVMNTWIPICESQLAPASEGGGEKYYRSRLFQSSTVEMNVSEDGGCYPLITLMIDDGTEEH